MSPSAIVDAELTAFVDEVGDADAVAVKGARTRWLSAGAPVTGVRLVSAPTGIVVHQPEEMTLQVRAGTMVADVHAALAEAGQRTALPERGGTVGGAVAVGENDLRVLGRGRLRASVLQVRYVSADGTLVTGGGPTVKNVTGFDLPRLMVGAHGTLGLLGEVILRTNPIPPRSIWLSAYGADPFAALGVVQHPSALLWDGSTTWIELEGHPADVDARHDALRTLAPFDECTGPPPLPPHRWSLTPAELRDIDTAMTGAFVASIGVGTVLASKPQPPRRLDPRIVALSERVKAEFDPTGRLNPGREPWSV